MLYGYIFVITEEIWLTVCMWAMQWLCTKRYQVYKSLYKSFKKKQRKLIIFTVCNHYSTNCPNGDHLSAVYIWSNYFRIILIEIG